MTNLIIDPGGLNTNPFINVSITEYPAETGKSKIKIRKIKEPSQDNNLVVSKAWLDSVEISKTIQLQDSIVESGNLSPGHHVWSVQSYIINSKIYQSLMDALLVLNQKKSSLEALYISETDVIKKAQLLVEIQTTNRRVNGLHRLVDDKLIKIGDSVSAPFDY